MISIVRFVHLLVLLVHLLFARRTFVVCGIWWDGVFDGLVGDVPFVAGEEIYVWTLGRRPELVLLARCCFAHCLGGGLEEVDSLASRSLKKVASRERTKHLPRSMGT